MLKLFFSTSLILLFIATSGQSKIDVLHYRYQLEVNDNNDSIYGNASITFTTKEDIKLLSFDLSTINSRKKGMMASEVGFNDPNSLSTKFSQENNKLIIQPQTTILKGDTQSLFIHYKGVPADGLIISKNKYGHRSFFADNWPNRGHNWIPCVDDPADKATVEFIVTAPQHYQVVANGIQIEETNLTEGKKRTHWKEDVPISTKVMVIGVADFAVNLSGVVDNCIPVYSWVYPEDRDKGFYDYAQANEILPFFIKNVGPYGYKKLANVQSKTTFGGLENANTIFYYENSITGTRKSEALLAHEIAHQWFGNMATEKSFAHLWLSEGFASYMTILYLQSKYGADTATKMLLEDRLQIIDFAKKNTAPVVNETKNYMELLNVNSYQKGSWVLHMLHRQLGDSVFWKSIRRYYADYAGKNADTKNLQQVFEKVSGKNLETFFYQWLYTSSIPKIDIRWNYLAKEKKLSVTIRQQQKVPFVFPLDLQLKTATGFSSVKSIQVSKQEETFFLPVKGQITSVKADPETALLFEGNITGK
ncbi:M1 family metallopeptidase [Terrimonas pollutisoli]|uniref:M1 family metallopeptidase n=1 Tax=Terrimonas pollutisoli TaxID=3034147 RepID=UPI0023ECB115|nr:M1 family metallopeptidase [Terrimonas sp. H1YJ31]